MNKADDQYLNLCQKILESGEKRNDRTGTGTFSSFGHTMRFDLNEGFPLLTTKKVFWKGVVHELLWFLSGDTNTKYLKENGVKIWDEWANKEGELGAVYGEQLRNAYYVDSTNIDAKVGEALEYHDQLDSILTSLKNNLTVEGM